MDIDFQQELFNREYNVDNIDLFNKQLATDKDTILCVNIRSLNSNYNKLLVFLKNLQIKPNIIVCTETWNMDHYEFFNIDGYKMYYNESKINKSDGVVLYILNELEETTEIIQINKLKIIKSKIIIENNKELYISAIYRSHDIHKTEFLMNFKELIQINKKHKNSIIVGDFNMDILSQENIEQEFLQVILENGYFPGINNITRPTDNNLNRGSCIDNFFVQLHNATFKTFIITTPFNDHYPIFLALKKFKKNINDQNKIMKTNYKKLKEIAETINWEEISQIVDPNLAVNLLIEKIQFCLNKSQKKL